MSRRNKTVDGNTVPQIMPGDAVTRFSDMHRPECETREYRVTRRTVERPSSVVWYFDCPWCGAVIKAYLWSLSGGGKRCVWGALWRTRTGLQMSGAGISATYWGFYAYT